MSALPCLGPLAPQGAVGARHGGLPRQFYPLLPVVCHGLSLSEGFAGPLCDVIGLPLLRLPSTVPCNITLVRPSDLVTCPYHFSFRRFTVARRSSYGPICFTMVFRTCSRSKMAASNMAARSLILLYLNYYPTWEGGVLRFRPLNYKSKGLNEITIG